MKKLSLIFFTSIISLGIFLPITTPVSNQKISTSVPLVFKTANAQQLNPNTAAQIATNTQTQQYDLGVGDSATVKCNSAFSLGTVGCEIGVFFVYDIFYSATSWLASITAGLADNLLWQSLQSWTYQNDFILTGWTIMRDLANISFIAGLLYAAFKLLSGDDGSGKKVVFMVVVLAIGINFSLFITRLMVDGGNILARSIYQNIDIVNISDANIYEDNVGSKKQISAGLVQIMNPQRLLEDPVNPGSGKPISVLSNENTSVFLFLFIFAGIVNILMMFMFIKIGLSFLGRTVGLMIMMIMAPITVFSELLPVKKMMPKKYLTLEGWFEEVWKLVVMAPIYVFFIYLMILFFGKASEQFKIADSSTGDWVATLISQSMPIIMTYFMMKAATDITESLSGEVGGLVAKTAGAVGGAVVGGGMMLVGAGAGRLIGGAIGTSLQRQGADAAASVQDRRLYQAALKKKREGRSDLTEDEQKAFAKITSIKSTKENERSAEQKEALARAEGDLRTSAGRKARAQDALATSFMASGSKLRKMNFDPRAASMFGLDIGGAMTGQLKTVSGLGGFMGYGGIEEKRVSTMGSYNEIVAASTLKEQKRIAEEAKVIDEAAKARKRKFDEEVEANKKSPEYADALSEVEGKIKANEKGSKQTTDEEDEYQKLINGISRKLGEAEELVDISNALTGNKEYVHEIETAVLNLLKDDNQTSDEDKKKIVAELKKRTERKLTLEYKEKSIEDLKKAEEDAKYAKEQADKDVKADRTNDPALKDRQKEATAELNNIKQATVLRNREKEALEKSKKDGTYISKEFNQDKKDLDKIDKEIGEKRTEYMAKFAEAEKISDPKLRQAAIEEVKRSKEMVALLAAEEKKFIQETFMKAKKGIASAEDITKLGNLTTGGRNADVITLAGKIETKINNLGNAATQKEKGLNDDERKKLIELKNLKDNGTINVAQQIELDRYDDLNQRYIKQQRYAFAEKVKKDLGALETHTKDMARVKQQFIEKEIAYVTEYGASMGKNLAKGLALGLATAATGGLAGVGFAGSAILGGAAFNASAVLDIKDFLGVANRDLLHMHYDESLQSRFRDLRSSS